jgi:hypothetical protein
MTETYLTATPIGTEFKPSAKMNKEIYKLLGLCDSIPDFMEDERLTVDYLERENVVSYIKTVESGEYVCVFAQDSGLNVTRPFQKQSNAVACALHYALINKSLVT